MPEIKKSNLAHVQSGRPTAPDTLKMTQQKKRTDPSSAGQRDAHYPVPSFFEYRVKPREHDPL